jgi:hypothetical protein
MLNAHFNIICYECNAAVGAPICKFGACSKCFVRSALSEMLALNCMVYEVLLLQTAELSQRWREARNNTGAHATTLHTDRSVKT